MRVAVTTSGKDMSAQVDPRFGRATGFLIVDTDTGGCEYVDNSQNMQSAQGAGIQAGQTVANTGVEAVLTGNCGPKAFMTLNAAGIKVYVGVSGTVAGAIDQLKAGELQSADGANVGGHWM